MSKRKFGFLAALLGLLTACGGGGGDSAPPLAAAVRVVNVQPASVQIETGESVSPVINGSDQYVYLRADLTGDLSRLNGKTVYVIIDDPASLFSVESTSISPNGLGNQVALRMRSTVGRSGSLEGELRLNICADASCQTPVGNSPVRIPYKINVLAGVKLSEAGPITVEVPFGTAISIPGPNTVAVVRPVTLNVPTSFLPGYGDYTQFWNGLAGTADGNFARLSTPFLSAPGAVPGELIFEVKPVGTYAANLTLQSFAKGANGQPVSTSVSTEVRYIVKESGKRVAFLPAVLQLRYSAIDSYNSAQVRVVGADKVVYTRHSRTVYSGNSAGVPWFTFSPGGANTFQAYANSCGGASIPRSTACLPADTYTALVYVATESGVEAPDPLPVTFVVQ